MTELSDKIREPFQRYLKEQQDLLQGSWEQLEHQQDVVYGWRIRKKRLLDRVMKPMQRWALGLKKMVFPLRNRKRYFKEKKRLMRAKHLSIYSWGGFAMRFKVFYMSFLNIIRIIFILTFFLGIFASIIYFLVKGLSLVKL
jgi:hypothetical protein